VLQRHTENLNYGTTRLIGAQTNALPQRLCTVKLCEASRAIDATEQEVALKREAQGSRPTSRGVAILSRSCPLWVISGHRGSARRPLCPQKRTLWNANP